MESLNKGQSVIGQIVYEVVHRDFIKEMIDAVTLCIETNNHVSLELKGINWLGDNIYICQINPIFQYNEKKWMNIALTDITDNYLEKKRIQQHWFLLNTILNGVHNGIVLTDPNNIIEYSNRAFASMLGYSIDQITGKNLLDYFQGDQQDNMEQESLKRRKGQNSSYELIYINSKELKIFLVNGSPRFSSEGEFIGSFSAYIDITKYKNLENRSHNKEEQYRLITENIPVITYTMENNFKHSISYISGKCLSITGYSPDEITNDPEIWMKLIYERDRAEVLSFLNNTISTEEDKEKEYRIINKNGGTIWVNNKISPVCNSRGQIIYFTGVILDISTRKKMIQEIKDERTKLRNLSKHLISIREEESSRISKELHDELGQQLTAMLLNLKYINGDKRIPEDIMKNINELTSIVHGTIGLTKNLISMLHPVILDDLGLISSLEWLCEEMQKNNLISIVLHSSGDDQYIEDNLKINIFRVFQESVTNAIKHSETRGIELDLIITKKEICGSIVDSGKGFLDKNKHKKGCFGIIGMEERIYALNGRFQINSSLNRGSIIEFTIPFKGNEYDKNTHS